MEGLHYPLASLPSRERGLKWTLQACTTQGCQVAPFTGAWIEMLNIGGYSYTIDVAPFTGAWIEMTRMFTPRRCIVVAPFAGAWIEIKTPAPCWHV